MVSFHVLGAIPGRAALPKLRSGQAATIRVIKPLGSGKWQVSIEGTLRIVESGIPLVPGQRVRVTAAWNGPRLTLRAVSDSPPLSSRLAEAGVPDDELTRLVVMALRRSRMSLEPARILALRELLARLRNPDALRTRLAVMAADKGLKVSADFVEDLAELVHGGGGRQGRSRERRRQRDPAESGREADAGRQIAEQCSRREDVGMPIHLFNHRIADHENWIIVPYLAHGDEGTIQGSIRVRTAPDGRTDRANITALSGDRTWQFRLNRRAEGRWDVRLVCNKPPDGAGHRRETRALREKLRNMGFDLDDNIGQTEDSDGFDSDAAGMFAGIDTLV